MHLWNLNPTSQITELFQGAIQSFQQTPNLYNYAGWLIKSMKLMAETLVGKGPQLAAEWCKYSEPFSLSHQAPHWDDTKSGSQLWSGRQHHRRRAGHFGSASKPWPQPLSHVHEKTPRSAGSKWNSWTESLWRKEEDRTVRFFDASEWSSLLNQQKKGSSQLNIYFKNRIKVKIKLKKSLDLGGEGQRWEEDFLGFVRFQFEFSWGWHRRIQIFTWQFGPAWLSPGLSDPDQSRPR